MSWGSNTISLCGLSGLVIASVALFSCQKYAYSRPEYSKQDPYRVYTPCTDTAETDLSYVTFGAIVLSLTETGWTIEDITSNNAKVFAKKCRVGECVEMIFKPYQDGNVSVFNPPDKPIPTRLGDDLKRWTDELEVPFSKYRCFTREAIEQEMSKYNFEF